MPMIYQSPTHPDQISFAIRDLVSDDLATVRIAVAYTTQAGCQRLVDALEERLGIGASQMTSMLLITSFDFGHTEPEALMYWRDLPNSEVRIANVQRVLGRLRLAPGNTNFHPKVYLFDHPNRVAALVGSANLTRRALSVNTEVAFAEVTAEQRAVNGTWIDLWDSGEVLTEQLFNEYRVARLGRSVPGLDSVIQVQPNIPAGTEQRLIDGIDQGLDVSQFQYMWIQAGSMSSGGSRNQLELPRGANKFFGFNYNAYEPQHVTIGQPALISRAQRWTDRSLTLHAGGGQNAMERLNLPTLSQGGFEYVNTAVLFRRTQLGFELTIAPWGMDRSNAWLNASVRRNALFRTGLGTNARMCGLF